MGIAVLFLSGCAQDIAPVGCEDHDFDCFTNQALGGIKVVRANISYWSNVHLIAQIFITISGIVATIMIALQGDENRYWTRPIGLVATALVTGLTSALVSFHVPDNVDKLIDVGEKMTAVANEFDYQATKLKAGRSLKEVEQAFKTDPQFRETVNDLTFKFVGEYNKIKIDMLRLSGSAGKLAGPNPITRPPKEEPAKQPK